MTVKNTSPSNSISLSLSEAATQFLIDLPSEERLKAQQEINKFVRWYGEGRLVCDLTIQEVSIYGEQVTVSTSESPDKYDSIKDFLIFAHKKGLNKSKLATHFKVKKPSSRIARLKSSHKFDRSRSEIISVPGTIQSFGFPG